MSTLDQLKKRVERTATDESKKDKGKSITHFEKGVTNCSELAKGMSLLMADILSERISTTMANAVCNGAGKMLKAAELQQRFGKTVKVTGEKELQLIG